ncbi:HAD family hydrolase [Aquimarina muelleri]|uniref:Haloacid dehalogenase n=1 Tax=Aquimarina muelleri TaxID=279356 RepID=A0A918JYC9_9FLAO|nr:HAD family phosphatase [Aquimarina muelleri]MCX2763380.1 HAD family phosphatase [Aquimarina muelleri]GGX28666.1 haloacid dehalogenase [Aquimarina muelleri]
MIKTIIFDFGDVFINLDKPATEKAFFKLKNISFATETKKITKHYETGIISTPEFINNFKTVIPEASENQIIDAWNAILLDFPKHRLEFLKKLATEKQYKLILLSNTNELHINWIKNHISFYPVFKSCFDAFYLSHEINLRKPEIDIFKFVLKEHQLNPEETLFIDDTKENTNAAATLKIHTWNNNPKTEDIIDLFTIKSDLF